MAQKFAINPFFKIPLSFHPRKFYGSQRVVMQLCETISGKRPVPPIELTSLPGMGKSTILRYLAHPQGALTSHPEYLGGIYRSEPYRLFPVLIHFKSESSSIHPFKIIYNQIHKEYSTYVNRTKGEFTNSLPNLNKVDVKELEAADHIEREVRELSSRNVRLVLLLDDFDIVFKEMSYAETTRMRPWRNDVAFVLCTEKPLHQVNREAAGSSFFASSPHLSVDGLNEKETMRILNEPSREEGANFPEKDTKMILEEVGNHPYLLIIAGKYLWETRIHANILENSEQPLSEIQSSILLASLKEEFEPIFNLYISNLKKHDLEVLQRISATGMEDIKSQIDFTSVASLHTKALLKVTTENSYAVFSKLFDDYLTFRYTHHQSVSKESGFDKLDLSKLEKKLYSYLNQNSERICTFDELWNSIWGLKSNEKTNRQRIQVSISRLRKKIRESRYNEGVDIVSFRDTGYKLTRIYQDESKSQPVSRE